MTSPAQLELQNVSVWYGAQQALAEINLPLEAGKITAIVGPSGCGKSTLLTTLNRLLELTPTAKLAGEVFLDGEAIYSPGYDVLSLRRRVGMVFQKPQPFPLSIRRNLSLPLWEHQTPRDQIAAKSEKALRQVGLWEEVKTRLDISALELSGGQQQRLCIARALALAPEAVLFDEPCSALDPLSSAVIEEQILKLRDRVTVVVVTHHLEQAKRLADYLAVMWPEEDGGRLAEYGEAEQVFEQPRHPRAAAYLEGRFA